MKKVLVIGFCSLLLALESHAQAGFRLGLKGGLNFASLDVSESAGDNYDSRTGYHIGAFATLKLTKLAIQPELVYSVQGANYSPGNLNLSDIRQDFSYLNVPILMKLYLIGGLNLQLGPQFGFLLSAKSEDDIVEEITGASDLQDAYKGSDVSIALGAGIDLPFGLTADARYNWGLSEIDDNESLNTTRNQVFQISVGYRLINLGK